MKHKRYDENLVDHTDDILKEYNTTIKTLYYAVGILAIISIVSLIGCEHFYGKLQKEIAQKELLQQEVQEEKRIINFERNVGYWFINKPEEINDSILYQFLLENNAWYPDILLKQAKLESGNYTSNVYKTNNNLYGMRRVYKRQTTQIGSNNGYGVYSNWCLSVLDRILWDYFTFDEKPDKEEYLKVLSIYAEDKDYIFKLK